MDLDSPWDDGADERETRETDWMKISTEFTNAGYREGITAGKESALQEGFDAGFVVGAPIGRSLGILRGISMGLVSFLASSQVDEARDIALNLGNIRFSDLAPRDLEAEEHAREHLEEDEELAEKRKMEQLEDMLAQLSAGTPKHGRPTSKDLDKLKGSLQVLCEKLGLDINLA